MVKEGVEGAKMARGYEYHRSCTMLGARTRIGPSRASHASNVRACDDDWIRRESPNSTADRGSGKGPHG